MAKPELKPKEKAGEESHDIKRTPEYKRFKAMLRQVINPEAPNA